MKVRSTNKIARVVAEAAEHGAGLTGSAKAVLRRLVREGASTRPQIGTELGLSRPTMSAAIGELERFGYVEGVGTVQGPLGRSAVQYRVGRKAGHVIAIDAGSTHVRLRASTLDGRLLHSRVHALSSNHFSISREISQAVALEFTAAMEVAQADWGPLRTLGIAVPTRVVGPGGDQVATQQNVVFSAFSPPEGVDVVLVNNVNCAAIAERQYGSARGSETFAFVQIGLKVGMGLILGGQLVEGRNGAAGEIGHLSFPLGPGLQPKPGEIERYLGAHGLMERVRAGWPAGEGPAPTTTAELLELAKQGSAAAMAHVEQHAADIGAVVATCVSVVDPGLVILGGGLGASPLFLPKVREVAERLAYPVEIRSTLLGVDATVLGIEKLAVERALTQLVGDAA